MKPIKDEGWIMNPSALTYGQLAGRKTVCPACGKRVFNLWPSGWDGHVGAVCEAFGNESAEEKKAAFKARWHWLFR